MIRTTCILLLATCWPAWAGAQPSAGEAGPFSRLARPADEPNRQQRSGVGAASVEEAARSLESPDDSGRDRSLNTSAADATSPLAARLRSLQRAVVISTPQTTEGPHEAEGSSSSSSPSSSTLAAPMVGPAVAPSAGAALAAQSGVLILRNGQTIEGRVCRVGDFYYVGMEDGEVRLRVAEVELICHDLVDGYQRKRDQLPPENATEHLRLAQWCQKVGLLEQAEFELAAARRIDARHPMLELLEQRQRLLREPLPSPPQQAPVGDYEVGPEELDRMTQQLAPGVAEFFTQTIQPILVNNCMTSGCHARPERSEYYLLRPPHDQRPGRRLTQRNLYETLKWIDTKQPDQSPLMRAAANPHGGQKVAPLGPGRTQQWQMLQFFVEAAARGTQSPQADTVAQLPAVSERIARPPRPSLAQNPMMQPPSNGADQSQSPPAEPQQSSFPISPMVGGTQQAGFASGSVVPAGSPKEATVSRWAGEQDVERHSVVNAAFSTAGSPERMRSVAETPQAVEPRRLPPVFDSGARPAAFEEPLPVSGRPGQPRRPHAAAAGSSGVGLDARGAPATDPFDPDAFNQKYFPNNRSVRQGTHVDSPAIARDAGG